MDWPSSESTTGCRQRVNILMDNASKTKNLSGEGIDWTLVIEPGRAERNYFRDLWRYRELFYFLAWRDILVRYKQPVIGVTWAVIRPLLTMVVFTLVFNKIAKLEAPGAVPYALLAWLAYLLIERAARHPLGTRALRLNTLFCLPGHSICIPPFHDQIHPPSCVVHRERRPQLALQRLLSFARTRRGQT